MIFHKRSKKTTSTKRRKAVKASNTCCPIIRVKCHEAPAKTKKMRRSDRYLFENPSASTYETVVVKPAHKVCSVSLGSKTVVKRTTSDKAAKRVQQLRKKLLDKRCQAIVQSVK